MLSQIVEKKSAQILKSLSTNPHIGTYIDNRPLPKIFQGTRKPKIVLLGQDPTAKTKKGNKEVKTVLNLDWDNAFRDYIITTCDKLGIEFEKDVYATNYIKNFFRKPPHKFKNTNVIKEFSPQWLPLLEYEISSFPKAPIFAIGDAFIEEITTGSMDSKVRTYWGYTPRWKKGIFKPLKRIEPSENIFKRVIFPFPNEYSVTKQFYIENLDKYLDFVMQDY